MKTHKISSFKSGFGWILVSYDSTSCSPAPMAPEYHQNLANKRKQAQFKDDFSFPS